MITENLPYLQMIYDIIFICALLLITKFIITSALSQEYQLELSSHKRR